MNILLTVVACLAACVAVVFSIKAAADARACENRANALRRTVSTVTGLEGAFESINGQLQKLRGQFHAFKFQMEQLQLPLEAATIQHLQRQALHRDMDHVAGEICENWRAAQVDGPHSDAAKCECDYCAAMRVQREAFRASAVPKTAHGQARLARLNGGHNGE